MSFGVVVTIVFGQFRVQQIKFNLASREFNAVWHGLYLQKQTIAAEEGADRQDGEDIQLGDCAA